VRGGIAVRVCFCGWSSWCLCGGVGVAGVSDAVVVGVGLVLVGYGGAVVLCIGYAVAVSGDLDREGEGVSGAGGIGDAQVCLVCSDSGEGASDLRRGGIDFVVSVTV